MHPFRPDGTASALPTACAGGRPCSSTARPWCRDNHAADNGGNGIDSYKTRDLVVEGNTITGSNVRGARHGYVGWSVAGSKNLLLHEAVFRNNTYEATFARGPWFDTDVKHVLVDGDRSCENLRDGVFVEAVQGPLTIRDTTYCRNGGAGVLLATSGNVVLERSPLTDNRYGQLVFTGDPVRTWSDHRTGETITMGDFENVTLTANVFLSTGPARLIYSPVIPIEDWRALHTGDSSTDPASTTTTTSTKGKGRPDKSDTATSDGTSPRGRKK